MISLDKACEIAVEGLVKKEYLKGIVAILDIGRQWLFFGTLFKEPGPQYGNCPLAVNKETGECKEFPISVVENFDMYYNGEPVEIPEKYRYQGR